MAEWSRAKLRRRRGGTLRTGADTLTRCAASQANGETTVAIQEVFSLEQLQAALDAFTQGTLGKIVIRTD